MQYRMFQHETYLFYACCLTLFKLHQIAELRTQDFLCQLKPQGQSVNMDLHKDLHIFISQLSSTKFLSAQVGVLITWGFIEWLSQMQGAFLLLKVTQVELWPSVLLRGNKFYMTVYKQQITQRTQKLIETSTSSQGSSGFQLDTVICPSSLFQIWSQRRFWNHWGEENSLHTTQAFGKKHNKNRETSSLVFIASFWTAMQRQS